MEGSYFVHRICGASRLLKEVLEFSSVKNETFIGNGRKCSGSLCAVGRRGSTQKPS